MFHFERNTERAGKEVARPPRKHADRRRAAAKCARDFHHGTVAAEHEHRVVLRGVVRRQLGGVTGPLGEDDVALDGTACEQCADMLCKMASASRRGVRNDNDPMDQKRHTCENERLKLCGVGARSNNACEEPQRDCDDGSYATLNDSAGRNRYSALAPTPLSGLNV